MTIAYTKKHLNIHLIYAFLFTLTLCVASLKSSEVWMLIIGILTPASFVAKYFYQKQKKYLTIEDEKIRVNTIFSNAICLNEVLSIEKYAGNYILKTSKKKLKIDTTIIEPKALAHLNSVLEKLNITWE
ncbi:MAG: hypothetical protein AAF617_15135 [Bacteroidota bacterium]